MSVIIFGASGFVGQNLVSAIADTGREVIAVSGSGRPASGAAQSVSMDQLDGLPQLGADSVCVHVAAQRYDASLFEMAQSDILTANVELTNKIYGFCTRRGIREVRLASSVAVYPATLPVMDDAWPVDLGAPPHASEAFYAWSKRWAEIVGDLYAERYGISTVAFRLSNPYGPMDSLDPKAAHVLPAFVMRALGPDSVFAMRGDPYVERDFIWVGDVVDVMLKSLDWRGRTDRFNLCTGSTVTLHELAQIILRVAGAEKAITFDTGFAPAAVRVRRSTADRLKAAFGIVDFTPLDTGLATTVSWYREALSLA